MDWTINYSDKTLKSLKKMDKQSAKRIVSFLSDRIGKLDDPRLLGKQLKGEFGDFWRYRVGDYRILCSINDGKLTILAATIGHRKSVYD